MQVVRAQTGQQKTEHTHEKEDCVIGHVIWMDLQCMPQQALYYVEDPGCRTGWLWTDWRGIVKKALHAGRGS